MVQSIRAPRPSSVSPAPTPPLSQPRPPEPCQVNAPALLPPPPALEQSMKMSAASHTPARQLSRR